MLFIEKNAYIPMQGQQTPALIRLSCYDEAVSERLRKSVTLP